MFQRWTVLHCLSHNHFLMFLNTRQSYKLNNHAWNDIFVQQQNLNNYLLDTFNRLVLATEIHGSTYAKLKQFILLFTSAIMSNCIVSGPSHIPEWAPQSKAHVRAAKMVTLNSGLRTRPSVSPLVISKRCKVWNWSCLQPATLRSHKLQPLFCWIYCNPWK